MKEADKLYSKYPSLFQKNCIKCRPEWYKVISQMCAAIQVYVDNDISGVGISPQFEYIREKYGVLDIHISNGDDIVKLITDSCEKLSYRTCEYCGTRGELYCSSKYKSWSYFKTLCLTHAIELFYYKLHHK